MSTTFDRRLIAAARAGLPLVSRPYDALGATLGVGGDAVRERLAALVRSGRIRRIGAAVDPARLGFAVDALTVWDVDDSRVDELGEKIGALDFVAHCCRRPRSLPDWPYNLHVAVHTRSRREAQSAVLQIHCLLAEACRAPDVLYASAAVAAPPATARASDRAA
jgi:DNA-binding Lrp family transcriptional regulator